MKNAWLAISITAMPNSAVKTYAVPMSPRTNDSAAAPLIFSSRIQ